MLENQTDDEDEDENIRMQPYSYRSKQTDNKSNLKTFKQDEVVDRLYTVKPRENNENQKALKRMIRVEDNSPNANIGKFLDKNLNTANKIESSNQKITKHDGSTL